MDGRAKPRGLKWPFDFLHDAVGFDQDFDDLLIMQHVVQRQCPVLAVLQPLLRWLITAKVKLPRD